MTEQKVNHTVKIYKVDFKRKKLLDEITLCYVVDAPKESRSDMQYRLYCEQQDRIAKLSRDDDNGGDSA